MFCSFFFFIHGTSVVLVLFKCGKFDNAGCTRRDRQFPRGPGRRHWLWMVVDDGPVAGILRCRRLGKSEMHRKKRLGARPGRSNQLCIVRPDGIQFALTTSLLASAPATNAVILLYAPLLHLFRNRHILSATLETYALVLCNYKRSCTGGRLCLR